MRSREDGLNNGIESPGSDLVLLSVRIRFPVGKLIVPLWGREEGLEEGRPSHS